MANHLINSGELDRQVRIEYNTSVSDGYGGNVNNWELWRECVWAGKKDGTGTENLEDQREISTLQTIWIIRYNPNKQGGGVPAIPTPKFRVIENYNTDEQIIYDVKNVVEIGRRIGWELRCETLY